MTEPLLRIRNLTKVYRVGGAGLFRRHGQDLRAVDDVDLDVWPGEAVGIVGESGSGKTTLGKLIVRLVDPTAGSVHFDGEDWLAWRGRDLQVRRRHIQMVFQDPFSSLNPRRTVGQTLAEPIALHRGLAGKRLERVRDDLLDAVQLPRMLQSRYPHELSGGQRQRVGLARALAAQPRLLVLDEPTSALDVSVQAQVLRLLDSLRRQLDLTYVFISHDLGVVNYLCDRVAVMYRGRIVEVGSRADLVGGLRHPYSRQLVAAVPVVGAPTSDDTPDADEAAPARTGCAFAPRCPIRIDGRCDAIVPPLVPMGNGMVACHAVQSAAEGASRCA